MGRCATGVIIRETQIPTARSWDLPPIRTASNGRCRRGCREGGAPCTVGGNTGRYGHLGKQCGGSQTDDKWKHHVISSDTTGYSPEDAISFVWFLEGKTGFRSKQQTSGGSHCGSNRDSPTRCIRHESAFSFSFSERAEGWREGENLGQAPRRVQNPSRGSVSGNQGSGAQPTEPLETRVRRSWSAVLAVPHVTPHSAAHVSPAFVAGLPLRGVWLRHLRGLGDVHLLGEVGLEVGCSGRHHGGCRV